MDMLVKLYNALIADPLVISHTAYTDSWNRQAYRVKLYEYPETADVSGPFIIIDPLGSPLPTVYGSNTPIIEEHLLQVDVWTKKPDITRELSKRVTQIFRENGFGYTGSGVDEYDKDTKIYRQARRYTGAYYTEEFEGAQ